MFFVFLVSAPFFSTEKQTPFLSISEENGSLSFRVIELPLFPLQRAHSLASLGHNMKLFTTKCYYDVKRETVDCFPRNIREFKKLRRQLQGKRHIKIELCVKLSLLRLFHVDHFVQNRRSALPLAWHEWFSCKGKE